jgi:hypothetical protein
MARRREVEAIRLNTDDMGLLIGLAAAQDPDGWEAPTRAIILRCKAAFLASDAAREAGAEPYVAVVP